jgi:hypothetical protein
MGPRDLVVRASARWSVGRELEVDVNVCMLQRGNTEELRAVCLWLSQYCGLAHSCGGGVSGLLPQHLVYGMLGGDLAFESITRLS